MTTADRLQKLADEAPPRVAEILRRTYNELWYWAPETRAARAAYLAAQLEAAGASEQVCREAAEAVVATVTEGQ